MIVNYQNHVYVSWSNVCFQSSDTTDTTIYFVRIFSFANFAHKIVLIFDFCSISNWSQTLLGFLLYCLLERTTNLENSHQLCCVSFYSSWPALTSSKSGMLLQKSSTNSKFDVSTSCLEPLAPPRFVDDASEIPNICWNKLRYNK